MKNVSRIYMVCGLLCAAASTAGAQSETKCFRADWLRGARVINLKINGREVTGTFTAEGEGRGGYREARARYLDSSKRFDEGARSQESTAGEPETAP